MFDRVVGGFSKCKMELVLERAKVEKLHTEQNNLQKFRTRIRRKPGHVHFDAAIACMRS